MKKNKDEFRCSVDSIQAAAENEETYIYLRGWVYAPGTEDAKWSVSQKQANCRIEALQAERPDVAQTFPGLNIPVNCGYQLRVTTDSVTAPIRILYGGREAVFLPARALKALAAQSSLTGQYAVSKVGEDVYAIGGWALALPGRAAKVTLTDASGKPRGRVRDLARTAPAYCFCDPCLNCGFEFVVQTQNPQDLILRMEDQGQVFEICPFQKEEPPRTDKPSVFQKLFSGFPGPVLKPGFEKGGYEDLVDESAWIGETFPDSQQLDRQRMMHFDFTPQLTLIVPASQADVKQTMQTLAALERQTYKHFQILVISDARDSEMGEMLLEKKNTLPMLVLPSENQSRTVQLNRSLRYVNGKYTGVLEPGVLLRKDALFEIIKAINEHPEARLVYSDSCLVKDEPKEMTWFHLLLKPDFSRDLLYSIPYFMSFYMMETDSLLAKRGWDLRFEETGSYDLLLRICQDVPKDQIIHIPHVLFGEYGKAPGQLYWTEDQLPVAVRALQEHFRRDRVDAEVIANRKYGSLDVRYILKENPLISVLIPNKDHIEDLDKVLTSLKEKNRYVNYEVIIAENNSQQEETFRYYESIQKEDPRIQVHTWKGPFNYSAINNFAASKAGGELYLLLNNDTEILQEDTLEEMAANAMRPDVGAVGACLFYGDGTLQHDGIVLMNDNPVHPFRMDLFEETSMGHYKQLQRNVSAVTAACLMVKAEAFHKVGGLEEALEVAYNDVDFCLKLMEAGYNNVILPSVWVYHYESKSRGLDISAKKRLRLQKEKAWQYSRWKSLYEKGDPFYNPNLSWIRAPYTLRWKRQIPEEQKIIAQAQKEMEESEFGKQ